MQLVDIFLNLENRKMFYVYKKDFSENRTAAYLSES